MPLPPSAWLLAGALGLLGAAGPARLNGAGEGEARGLALRTLSRRVWLIANPAVFGRLGCGEAARTAHPGGDCPTGIAVATPRT